MDAGPYDNVEFPPVRPGSQTWSGPQSSTKLYGYNVGSRDRVTGNVTPTLAPVAESDGNDYNEELAEIGEQRQLINITSPPGDTVVNANKEIFIANTHGNTPNAVAHKSATMPNLTQQKFTPQPSPSLSRTVVEQPRSIAKRFTELDLNPRSQDVFSKTHATKGKALLYKSLMEEGNRMKENVWDVKGKPGEMLSYEQLLQGMLIEGEMLLLGGSWLQFSNIDFLDPTGKESIKPSVGRGRLCLTNQRLLILSADIDSDANLKNPKETEYTLEISKCTTTYFQNIPLNGVLAVELSAVVGNSQESRIVSQKPCCCCGFCSCLPIPCCMTTWKADVPVYKTINNRTIKIGVVMPPWLTQTLIVVHLHPDIPLTTGRDFVSLLHNHAPRIH
ncbi:unnamed protein product [Mytilus edulis]|uniref:Uncharacterized protein n=1 Tax=Mytilus edulis TaxID=6550 RepID=A0A8S3UA22_MYTED|nr:unnamed protein product [Mytilus edulis]